MKERRGKDSSADSPESTEDPDLENTAACIAKIKEFWVYSLCFVV